MKKIKWSKQYDCCQKCGTIEIPHEANGLCKKCYRRTPEYKEFQKKYFNSQKGKNTKKRANKRYINSQKGIKALKIAQKKYFASQKGKKALKKYAISAKGSETFRKHRHKYRTIKNGNYFWLPFYNLMWQWAKELTFGYCPKCGEPFDDKNHKLTMDHIIPISKDGIHSIDNVRPLCKSCNSRKYNRLLFEGGMDEI